MHRALVFCINKNMKSSGLCILLVALIFRILSNPCANMIQKKLSENHSAILINLYSYVFLSLFCIFPAHWFNWSQYGVFYWGCVVLSGLLCTLSSVCLIKALEFGEMSILGPINSYKCVIGLIFGLIFLKEIPDISGLFGMITIILGSWLIFDTTKEGFSFALLKRKDIILRFLALFFSGTEAVVLKKIIILSSPLESFILWCFSGCIFSFVFMILLKRKFCKIPVRDMYGCLGIAVCLGIMQLSTNYVFQKMNVGFGLALFQLSSIVAVILGYKMFGEKQLVKKILGTVIMIVGSCLIIL